MWAVNPLIENQLCCNLVSKPGIHSAMEEFHLHVNERTTSELDFHISMEPTQKW